MQYRIFKDYTRQYADPIAFERGETIQRERSDDQNPAWWWCTDKRGKGGWVHESYFEDEDFGLFCRSGTALDQDGRARREAARIAKER